MRNVQKIMNDWMFTNQNGKKRPVDLPHTLLTIAVLLQTQKLGRAVPKAWLRANV